MTLALIPCAPTDWRRARRLLGRVELAPSSDAELALVRWQDLLAPLGLTRIYHSGDDLCATTARRLGRRLKVATRTDDELAEVDLGLWAGLTEADLETRYESAFRELEEAPLNVSPPGGESLAAAHKRIGAAIARRRQRHAGHSIAFVLRPLAMAFARTWIEGRDVAELWSLLHEADEPIFPGAPGVAGVRPTPPGDAAHDGAA